MREVGSDSCNREVLRTPAVADRCEGQFLRHSGTGTAARFQPQGQRFSFGLHFSSSSTNNLLGSPRSPFALQPGSMRCNCRSSGMFGPRSCGYGSFPDLIYETPIHLADPPPFNPGASVAFWRPKVALLPLR